MQQFNWSRAQIWKRRHLLVAAIATLSIAVHLVLRLATSRAGLADVPLLAALAVGGTPLVIELGIKLLRLQFGSDLLAAISIVTAAILGEYLAGAIVVLMLSGGEAIEAYAVGRASSALRALASRMPTIAHRSYGAALIDVSIDLIAVNDLLTIFPHEICPADGVVTDGHGTMDESYLTGEPFQMSKTPGSDVLSGAINGENALTIRVTRRAVDSRYAKIMIVMRDSEQHRPRMRRLADSLGAIYTPIAVAIALMAWAASGQSHRFLAVLVVATPCPLLIAIPVAIIGAISLAARRGIIVKKPEVLEQVAQCRTVIFDKTGTLTYGEPRLAHTLVAEPFEHDRVLSLIASIERYSKHPLAISVGRAASDAGLALQEATSISEPPGGGLRGVIAGHQIQITSRKKLSAERPDLITALPPTRAGLECVALIDGVYAATLQFRDEPRSDGFSFVRHLRPKHQFFRMMLVSGDRESEVRYLAAAVGIEDIYWSQTPEQKLQIVREQTRLARTLYLGDGINDAPALAAATVGIALGKNSDVTGEAAGVVIMDSSLTKVDEFFHIGRRLRRIALQSALGGMALSALGMLLAATGHLPAVAGAICQEVIDLLAVANALRASWNFRSLSDCEPAPATGAVKQIPADMALARQPLS